MEILLDLPDDCNPNLIAQFQQLARVVSKMTAKGPRMGDFARVEESISDACAKLEAECIGQLLSSLDVEVPYVEFDGERYKNLGPAPKTFHTMAGDVTIERCLFRSTAQRNGPTLDPIALRAGVIGDCWLPSVAKAMAKHIATVTSREAASLTSSTRRLPYSRSSFERVGHLVGAEYCRRSEEIADVLAEKFVVPAAATSVSVSLDRVAVPMEEIAVDGEHIARNYRMAHCGTLTFHDADGDALHVVRYGRMPAGDIDNMDELMQADLRSALADRPKLRVVALADGASEMWNRLDLIVEDLEQDTTRLVDFWHVCEYLAAAAAVIDGDQSSNRLSRWKHLLLNAESAIRLVLGELDEYTDIEPVAEAVRYVENHGDRLNYARARTQGLPIGSGNIEATCKSLVSQRFKRSGARWKIETGEHVLQLRALQLSDRWEDAMDETLKPLRRRVVARAS